MLVIYFPCYSWKWYFLSPKSLKKNTFSGAIIQLNISTCGFFGSKNGWFSETEYNMEVYVQVQYVDVHTCFLPMQGFDHSWLHPSQFEKYCDNPARIVKTYFHRHCTSKKWRCSRRSNPLLILGSLILHMEKHLFFISVMNYPPWVAVSPSWFFQWNMGLKAIRGRRW